MRIISSMAHRMVYWGFNGWTHNASEARVYTSHDAALDMIDYSRKLRDSIVWNAASVVF